MSEELAISLRGVSKCFKRYDRPIDRLKELLIPGKSRAQEFWALRDIDLNVPKGQTLGIVGRNGSGKSTLLQIIAGTLTPTMGSVQVNGRVSALLELGSGFNPEFTGRQNVFFNGQLLGLTKGEVEERFDTIAAFADIGDFIDQPVKTYSSGMFVRLAFAVAVHVDPEILIIDEALAVGDMFFQAKCVARMRNMLEQNTTVIFVSHDLDSVKGFCDFAVLLEKGCQEAYGESSLIASLYIKKRMILDDKQDKKPETTNQKDSPEYEKFKDSTYLASDQYYQLFKDYIQPCIHQVQYKQYEAFLKSSSLGRASNRQATFIYCGFSECDETENCQYLFTYGQTVSLNVLVSTSKDLEELFFGYHIKDRRGIDIIYSDNLLENYKIEYIGKNKIYMCEWTFTLTLRPGDYSVSTVCSTLLNPLQKSYSADNILICDFIPSALHFKLVSGVQNLYLYGAVHWENQIMVKEMMSVLPLKKSNSALSI